MSMDFLLQSPTLDLTGTPDFGDRIYIKPPTEAFPSLYVTRVRVGVGVRSNHIPHVHPHESNGLEGLLYGF